MCRALNKAGAGSAHHDDIVIINVDVQELVAGHVPLTPKICRRSAVVLSANPLLSWTSRTQFCSAEAREFFI